MVYNIIIPLFFSLGFSRPRSMAALAAVILYHQLVTMTSLRLVVLLSLISRAFTQVQVDLCVNAVSMNSVHLSQVIAPLVGCLSSPGSRSSVFVSFFPNVQELPFFAKPKLHVLIPITVTTSRHKTNPKHPLDCVMSCLRQRNAHDIQLLTISGSGIATTVKQVPL